MLRLLYPANEAFVQGRTQNFAHEQEVRDNIRIQLTQYRQTLVSALIVLCFGLGEMLVLYAVVRAFLWCVNNIIFRVSVLESVLLTAIVLPMTFAYVSLLAYIHFRLAFRAFYSRLLGVEEKIYHRLRERGRMYTGLVVEVPVTSGIATIRYTPMKPSRLNFGKDALYGRFVTQAYAVAGDQVVVVQAAGVAILL